MSVSCTYYSPMFNQDPRGTLNELEEKVNSSEGKKRLLYKNLLKHYEKIFNLGEELNN